jgi:hypothetical protein
MANGVGFDKRLLGIKKNAILLGCFHTRRTMEIPDVNIFFQSLEMRHKPTWLRDLELASMERSPMILHIRRGDYTGIKELGFLNMAYFESSVDELLKHDSGQPIWIFSDDFDYVNQNLRPDILESSKLIDYDKSDSVGNLEAMRLGSSYVLSNSTYSWWAASISRVQNPMVICPKNWFLTKPNPQDLLPPNWKVVSL